MRLLTFPAGRVGKWVVLGAWVLLALALGPLAGRFEDAQQNEPASFLPGSAESVAVLEATERFPSGEVTPAVAVYRREGGLTPADRSRIVADRAALEADRPDGVQQISGPSFSEDGAAALIVAGIRARGDSDLLQDAVTAVRDRVGDGAAGLDVAVSGPAGFSADAIEVFSGINTTLLLATVALVFVLLIVIYRSPVFWVFPLLAVGLAEVVVRATGYGIAEAGVTVNGQSAGILLVLVFGAGTDYALLLVARYREELRRHEDRHEAMAIALRRAGPAILASAATNVAALMCLLIAEVNGTSGLGPIGAMGIAVAMVAILTALPAFLVIVGRTAFWPFVPRFGAGADDHARGAWRRFADRIGRRPRRVWIGTTAVLAVMCIGVAGLDTNLTSANDFREDVESVRGQELISRSFPGGANAPTSAIVADLSRVDAVRSALEAAPGVASLGPVERGEPGARFDVTLEAEPYSREAYDLIPRLRDVAKSAGGDTALIGGPTAEEADFRDSASRDNLVVIPIVLVVVLAILAVLLRAIAAPLLLVATVVVSFLAALGISAVVFDVVFGFPGESPTLPLFAFIFLVALGVDYNIFLMARVREEAQSHGTREGMLHGLSVTGGVITAAGIVLAGTFSVLGVLPLVTLTEIGFVVAFGVLLDTFVVRSILVPALVLDAGRRTWWPSALSRIDWTQGPGPASPSPEAG